MGTVSGIVKDLDFCKLSAWWIPKLLSDSEKQVRVDIAQKNLRKITSAKNIFFERMIAVDETWIHHE